MAFEKEALFWNDRFDGDDVTPTKLPYNKSPNHAAAKVQTIAGELSAEVSQQMIQLSRGSSLATYMVLLAGVQCLLYKYTSEQTILIGMPVVSKPGEASGYISPVVMLKETLSADQSFKALLNQVKLSLTEAIKHQNIPFRRMTERLELQYIDGVPVVNTLVSLKEIHTADVSQHVVTDLALQFSLENGRVSYQLAYNENVYHASFINQAIHHLHRLFAIVLSTPELEIGQVDMLQDAEKQQLLHAFNETSTAYPRERTIHQLFEEQAEQTPEAVAVVYEQEHLTYRELNERANRLARTLRARGVQADELVGLMTERSLEMIVGIMAILKAGGAYVPIDPEYPEERIRYMLDDSGAGVLLAQRDLYTRASFDGVWIDLDDEASYDENGSNLESVNGPEHLTYVIYTSGTTGKPKGNLTTHRNIIRVVRNTNYVNVNEKDSVLQLSSYSFDGSTFDIFGALLNGARLILVPKDTMLEVGKLADLIEQQHISVMFITTAFFNVLIDMKPDCLRYIRAVLFGGERVSVNHVRKALEHLGPGKIKHVYGPTESTVFATCHDVNDVPEDTITVPIGRPISNTAIYIVDAQNRPQPLGVAGELCVAGDGLARGYLNRPELTAEKFADNPFAPGERMYRTGDLARWLPDGTIEYVGRIDDQVKIRGFRIELGEIESHLLKLGAIEKATVVVRETEGGEKQLCAYFVADSKLMPSELRTVLSQELPGHMIPTYFVQLEQMPLTTNGKVDRRALPAPEDSMQIGMDYVAPRTPLEAKLAHIWQEVLGLERVGIQDNFFELGGHSLRATTLVGRIHKELNVSLPLKDVFRSATVEKMAEAIQGMAQQQYEAIPQTEASEHYPVSSAQKRLYILHQLEGAEQSYNMPGALLLEGSLERERLEAAFHALIARHETLRTGFELVDGEPVQRVYPQAAFAVEYMEATEAEAERKVREFIRAFDLKQPPLLRVGLVQLAEERHILLVDMHHIISDGVSVDVLVEEFARLYGGKELPALRIQYKDYAVWQQSAAQRDHLKQQEGYWLNQFSGELPVLELPTDYARPAVQRYEGRTLQFRLNAEQSEGLKRIAAENGATLYMVLLAAYTVLLHKYTGQEDIVVGTPIAGRTHGDLQPLIGMFVNTLALRSCPAGEKSFLSYLEEIKQTTLGAYEHQDYPFEQLVEALQVARDLSRSPLFDTMFSLQNIENKAFALEGLRLTTFPSEYGMSKFDLSLDVMESSGGLECALEYATALFKQATMERLAKHFEQLVAAIVENPGAKLAAFSILTAKEQEQLERVFNPETAPPELEKTFHQLFEEQVERSPEATAVVYTNQRLTYRELNERANRLARILRGQGVKSDQLVGILADRSVELLVGVLAVWKAGGAYVPLDPDYPSDRIRFMLEDSGAEVLLTQTHLAERAQEWLTEAQTLQAVLCLDDETLYSVGASDDPSHQNLPHVNEPGDLAYVIYTSGTTGRPKGVMIEHRSLVNTADGYRREYRLGELPVRLLQLASFSFDVFVGDIARTLYNGGTMVICPQDDRIDPARLHAWIRDEEITLFESTPALIVPFMGYIAEQGLELPSLQLLITSSDSCSVGDYRELQERFGAQIRIINAYGVTEAAIDSSYYEEPLEKLPQTGNVPIGKAWLNARFAIVDAHLNPVPVGVLGELCIGGAGVARGYWNQPELTEEKFVPSPFEAGERLYRTGDLARWMPDGNVDFIGRIDHQAKIRGYRIEIGEIESQLLKAEGVREAVVVVREDAGGEKALCAYYTAEGERKASELRSALSQELPGYMIPSYFVQMERLPLTANGKLDRKALPAPEGGQRGVEHVAPRTALEAELVRIWQEVLGAAQVGIRDNFFELGGHSLRATTLVSKIHKELNVELPLREVFRHATIEDMAGAITQMEQATHVSIPAAEASDYYPMSSAQRRLYILRQMAEVEQSYNMPGAMLLEGALDRERFEAAFGALIARHETLRTGFELVDGEPMQRIYPQVDFAVEYKQAANEREADELVREFVRPFDLMTPPLLRVGLIELRQDRHVLMFDMHHIISDGISTDVLVEEFISLYAGEELPSLRIQYKDYAVWQQSESQKERIRQQEAYWLEQLGGELPVLELPLDYVRPAVQQFHGHTLHFRIDAQKVEGLRQIAADSGATLYMVLLAAYNVLLHKYTGQEDMIVGTPIAGRTHEDLQPLIGMFVNTLAIRSYPAGAKTFLAYLEEVKEATFGAYEHQDYPFEELVEKLEVTRDLSRNPLFDTMFALQNTENKELALEGLQLKPYPSEYTVAKFDLILDITEGIDDLGCSIEYATSLYRQETMERMAKHYEQLLGAIVSSPQATLATLGMLTAQEEEQLHHVFNDTVADYPSGATIHQLIEEQAERTPEHAAVVFEGSQLSYRELNERANQLARTLRAEGVQVDEPVGLMLERSLEMIVGILAVLKAGGAYVPIDPEYPEERIRYMLEDSGAKLLLVQSRLRDRVAFEGKLITVDDEQAYAEDRSNLEPVVGPNHLAYVIYTSGTTGKPKGVMVEHHGLCSLKLMFAGTLGITDQDRVVQFASLSFDAACWEIYKALFFGATLYIPTAATILDVPLFESYMNEHGITAAILPPTYATYLKPEHMPRFKKLITGGSAVSVELVKQWKDKVAYFNAYGPTEASIVTSMWTAPSGAFEQKSVPIGRPIANHQIYILDAYNQPLPVGVAGELCIAGVGLARGYLNRPELTAEKFVDHPFAPGERMYRTGDLTRWLPDGNIEYLGRIDHQVKIRGYRIELGEIEEQLLKVAQVQEAIVLAREDESGQNQLCAYFVAHGVLTASELRAALSQELPGYMIPSYFMQLEQMPITQNGKIDRKALPAPEGNMHTGGEYIAPRSEAEKTLAAVWKAVLGAERISVTDHFFELGGDSIKSIQVSSRLHQAGYKLEIRDLFKYPTVAQLSHHIRPIARMADQGEVTGEVALAPIQRWFFEQQFADPHHFNQSVMLYRKQGFNEAAIRKVLQRLAEHHDALRIVFRQTEHGYQAWNRGVGEGELYSLETVDLKGVQAGLYEQALEARANDIQSSINLESGPLVKSGLFRGADGDHWLIAIHHGVIDGVSWRILLEDIASGYEQAVKGEEIRLPAKTDSYRVWTEQLAAYAQSPAMKREEAYWQRMAQTAVLPLPKDQEAELSLQEDSETITIQWSAAETELLLKQVHKAYNTEMNDILLTALGTAIQRWSRHDRVLVNLEGHGRESILPDIDITRTVGWFTSKYPVLLEMEPGKDMSYRIKQTKEMLRQVPNKGIGYGIWRYLSEHTAADGWGATPQISFNYLGQFDQDLQHNELGLSPLASGAQWSGKQARSYVLDMNGMIADGSLTLDLGYSGKEYRRETMEELASCLQESLRELIAHCAAQERTELTPSDVQLKGLSLEELEQLAEQTRHLGQIENIYALTPMQKGMWFHNTMDQDSGAYFEQARFTLRGALHIEWFAKSWEELAVRHAVLRTNFYSGWNGEPMQIVFRDRRIGFAYKDLTGLQAAEQQAQIDQLEQDDKARGFDLQRDALARVTVIRTAAESCQVLWSFHHILMDGWCLPQLTKELFETYSAYVQDSGREDASERNATPVYSQYIEWLERQDMEAAARYWAGYLAGYEGQTVLPQAKTEGRSPGYALERIVCDLGNGLSEQMSRVAKRNQVTVNTLMQAAWGVMLQKYNGTGDVVFGNVVSGRPAEIPGIEEMIGLFINTIPLRVASEPDMSFAEVMGRLQEQALESGRYDYYPLYEIQAQSTQKQDLISHIMAFENYPVDEQMEQAGQEDSGRLAIADVEMAEQTNYDFTLTVLPGDNIQLHLDYNAHVYDRADMERLKGHLVYIFEQIVDNPLAAVGELELATAGEKAEIVERFNDTATEYPRDKTLHQLFEEQAQRRPDAVALVLEDQQFTYGELNERANKLARTLRAQGVDKDHLVALMAERSMEMIVGMLAILKAGGAYVAIDPEYPEERIRYMIEDSGAQVMLAQRQLRERIPTERTLIFLDDEQAYSGDGSNLESGNEATDLVCVIYTSGTTGKPKGNLTTHRNLMRIVRNTNYIEITDQDHVLQLSSYSFDGSAFDIFGALTNGARLVLVPKETMLDVEQLASLIERQHISVMLITTAFFNVLVDANVHCLRHLRVILFGGERVSVSHVRKALSYIGPGKLKHAYGPSESAVYTTWLDVNEVSADAVNIPIGQPLSNTTVYIVDARNKLQPIGVAGELCVGGDGLVRGYLNRPELTAEKFVDNPFAPGERMYRTGDLARWLPDGTIEYVGRIDDQVKIRGFRIELGEIESHLLKVEPIEKATVVVRETEGGEKQLCAYFVAGSELAASELRSALSQELPGYMIPTYFVQLEQMPLTTNGKVDRRALPAPEDSMQTGMDYVAPRTLLEAKLAHIWQDVLGLERVGVQDNFFELGGHSLRATTLVGRIHKELNVRLPLKDVFRFPTVEELATAIGIMEQQAYSSIPAIEAREHYPVSSAQKRLYILHQLEGAEQSYNMPGAMLLEGRLERERFEAVFRALVARHETLRTGFELVDGEPVQRIYPDTEFAVEYMESSEAEAERKVREFIRAFDLKQPPLLRVGLIQLAEERHILLVDMHHIISDGVSTDVLVEEFARLYGGEELPALRIQYKDYAVWQQSAAQRERLREQEAYWLSKFSGELPVLELPTDYARPAVQQYEGHTLQLRIDAELSEGLKRIAAENGATLYMVLLAAYTVLLHKYTGQEDIVVGTPIAGRTHGDLQPLIGMFVNTLVLRNSPAGEKTFLSYLEEVKETTLGAYEHQDYPFEELVEKLQVARDLSRSPLFDTMFSLQNIENKAFALEGLRLTTFPSDYGMSKFDLSFDVMEDDDGLECALEYATALFKQATMERLAKHFVQLVTAIVENPGAKLAAFGILTAEEQEQLERVFNPETAPPELEKTFHQLFEDQAERSPEAMAVVYTNQRLTYRELNERANCLARRLRGQGVKPDQLVGILADRSVDLLVGVLAVWKAGGAYVPLDPDYPSDRIRFMLEDSGAEVLLTQTHLAERAQEWLTEAQTLQAVLCLDDESLYSEGTATKRIGTESNASVPGPVLGQDGTDDPSHQNLPHVNEPGDLAYVIYTSGTTGRPKGVMIEHRSLVNTADGYRREYRLGEFPVRLLQLASFSFDVFVGDIARTLYNGGTMVICPQDDRIDPARLYAWIRDEEITLFESTPALIVPFMSYIAEQGLELPSLQLLITSSDSCSVGDYRELQERFGAQIRIINAYGVTEAAIDSSYYEEPLEKLPQTGNVPIGKAWLNARFAIVDAHLNPVPVGVLGELCIGGAGVARGYWNQPELTEEKFVPSPFESGERLYRTGDLARWMPDGNVDFIGRIDHQAKIRGYRIEIGEIESQLLKAEGVREAVVVVREDAGGEKALCAYYTAEGERKASELRAALSQELPGYMIPSYFVQLERLPLTANGKLDRKALPAPEGGQRGVEHVAPRTALESELVRIWQEVLGAAQVGIRDNFFELGGHSLRATTLVSKIHKELNVELPLREVFRHATIEDMATAISQMEQAEHVSIPVAEASDYYPLSSTQKRLYILHQMEEAQQSYNMPGAMLLEGELDRERLEAAFRTLIARHETLRSGFELVGGEPVQRIHPQVDFAVEYKQAEDEQEAARLVHSFIRSFELMAPPLLRIGLIELGQSRHVLMFDMHHIISDGVSMEILVEEFVRLYSGEELSPLRIQYKDYAVWQQSESQKERMKQQEAYWLEQLGGELPVLELPTDFARPVFRSFKGDAYEFVIDARKSAALRQLASESGATLYMVLMALYTTLLHKYSGQEDIIVGSPIAGRNHGDLEPLIGMFVNTLAIRSYPSGEKSFRSFLKEVQETTMQAYEHQDYPFEELVEQVQVTRDVSRNPLFDTLLVMQNVEEGEFAIDGLRLAPFANERSVAKFDLTLEVAEDADKLVCGIEYATALYTRETVERLAKHFDQLVEAVIETPSAPIEALDMVTAEERIQLLHAFNDTDADYPREQTIHGLFEEQAERHPGAVAVEYEDERLTYRELNERANRLARTLRGQGVGADQLVGIMAERSPSMVIGILAILKAGGAYVPIDPDYPEERIRYMLDDSGTQVLLLQSHLQDKAAFAGVSLLLDDEQTYAADGTNLASVNEPHDLAYVIYTSGTTGKPKGTLIEHRNVVRLLFNSRNLFDFGPADTWTLFHSFCFDFSVWEMYGALLYGGKLVIVPPMIAKHPAQFLHLLKEREVTILNQTPTYFYQLLREALAESGQTLSLRKIVFGGEALAPQQLKEWRKRYPATQLINMYGITETTVHVTYKEITEVEIAEGRSNIGRPIPTLKVYVLDANRRCVPAGVAGEMYVAGEGLARGYLNRPELTAEKFVDDPFTPGERLYRSGDLARWLPDGNIEYMGRIDHQVKVRGYRIELGEVEAQLLKLESVQEAVVMAREDGGREKQLCAYLVADKALTVSELRGWLSEELPGYMIPSYFVQLERMPLTANGKTDRKALPAPEGSVNTGAEYIAPRTPLEEQLVRMWQEVLGAERIGVKDNFFDLGGHSLRATALVSKLYKELSINLPLRDVFRLQTIEEMAQAIADMAHMAYASIPVAEERAYYPLASAQKRLYILHQLEGAEQSYNMPEFMMLEGSLNRERFEEAFRKLIARHEILRTGFEMVHGEPVQRVHAQVEFEVEYGQADEAEVEAIVRRFVRTFDLKQAPLLRVGLVKLESERHLLMVDMHHLISDGVSMGILVDEWSRLYAGEELPALRIQYKDYAVWQQQEAQRERMNQHEGYWLRTFEGELPVADLPTDYERPAVRSFEGAQVEFELDAELAQQLNELAATRGSTLYMVLLSAYHVLLSKYSGQEDIIVGTPVAGRTHPDVEPLLGMFVNTLAIRNYPVGDKTFASFLEEVKETTLGAFEHQEYPFEELVERLKVRRDASRNPLFDTMFVMQNTEAREARLEELHLTPYVLDHTNDAKFDLSLFVAEDNGVITGGFQYCTKLFKPAMIHKMMKDYVFVLSQICDDPGILLHQIECHAPAASRQGSLEDIEFAF
ncbi:non-ribosomal peptide synthetase [Paenibacillus sp. SYP-B4298]|uniref:non-ribosomal peptide synthetase n=1 Tax=Paenibacillus sp. SYP-B4298 TaxID=2996034 RepID=UPI0022DD8B1C|nr:non-ribosomal peptide synthetase [Paenibacillus sp. SYP-B4298]